MKKMLLKTWLENCKKRDKDFLVKNFARSLGVRAESISRATAGGATIDELGIIRSGRIGHRELHTAPDFERGDYWEGAQ